MSSSCWISHQVGVIRFSTYCNASPTPAAPLPAPSPPSFNIKLPEYDGTSNNIEWIRRR